MKKIAICLALAAGLPISSAYAQSAQFAGPSVQIGVGLVENKIDAATIYDVGLPATNGEDITGPSDSKFGTKIGFTYAFPVGDQWTIGIGVETNPFGMTIGSANGGEVPLNSKQTSSYDLFVQPGFVLDRESQLYAKLGYAVSEVSNDAPGATVNNNRYKGYLVGIGYKRLLGNNLFMFGEANYESYGSERVTADAVIYADRK